MAFTVDGPVDGPPLLLLHSLGWSGGMWDPQVPRWGHRYRVVRMDFRGHGASPAPPGPYTIPELAQDALDVLDELGIERAHVCGLSLGGQVALELAATRPERVDRLIACATAAKVGTEEGWRERASAVRDGGLERIADLVMERFFSEAFRAGGPPDLAEARAALLACSTEGYAGCCAALGGADLSAALGDIRAPALLVAGETDISTPPAELEHLRARIGQASLMRVPDAGHLLNREAPELLAGAVLAHLG